MVNLIEINKEIQMIESDLLQRRNDKTIKEKEMKKGLRRLAELKYIKLFLETSPTAEIVSREINRLTLHINTITDAFAQWVINNHYVKMDETKAKALFNKEMQLASVKRQLKFLKTVYK